MVLEVNREEITKPLSRLSDLKSRLVHVLFCTKLFHNSFLCLFIVIYFGKVARARER